MVLTHKFSFFDTMKKTISINYDVVNMSELNDPELELVRRARECSKSAYAPYSMFQVGASLLLENGEIISGSNQENIAYPSGLCAERVALFYAGANFPGVDIVTLCIVAEGDLIDSDSELSPCGGCRQVMAESELRQAAPIKLLIVNQNNTVSVFQSARMLLPLTFGV